MLSVSLIKAGGLAVGRLFNFAIAFAPHGVLDLFKVSLTVVGLKGGTEEQD